MFDGSRLATHLGALAALGLIAVFPPALAAQEDPAVETPVEGVDYRIYAADGSAASITDILAAADSVEVLLVGEDHGDMVGHWFEAELLGKAIDRYAPDSDAPRSVVLSLEMFERDVQYVVNEYLDGLISEEHFMHSSRPWPHYARRYRPLVETAKQAGLSVVASNAPRRYVNRVTREGRASLSDLSEQARSFLPPLPYPGPTERYRFQWEEAMAEMVDSMRARADSTDDETRDGSDDPASHDRTSDDRASNGGTSDDQVGASTNEQGGASTDDQAGASTDGRDSEAPPASVPAAAADSEGEPSGEPAPSAGPPEANNPNAVHSQALWDAAMADAIVDALGRDSGALVLHFAGSFHVEKGTGIPESLASYRPETGVLAVVMTGTDDIDEWEPEEHGELGDFVVLTRLAPEEPEEVSGEEEERVRRHPTN